MYPYSIYLGLRRGSYIPKGPCSQIDIHRPQSTPNRDYLKAKVYLFGYMDPQGYRYFRVRVYTIWVHGAFGSDCSLHSAATPWPLWPSAGVSGLGFRVLGFSGLGFWVFGFRVSGLGFRGFKLNHDKTREQPLPRDTENLGRHAWSTGSSESPVQVCGS